MTISKYSLLIPILNYKGELISDFSVSAILMCCLNLGHSSATRRKTINSISSEDNITTKSLYIL
jgi:hypothetical protein